MTDFCFKIFNSTWTVTYVDQITEDLEEGEFRFGDTCYTNNKIRIALKDHKGERLPETTIKLTTLHEMVHAILFTGQYTSVSNDEPIVEWIANCLYSIKEQGKL